MALSTADRLGPYEILSPIGAGGMGDVYKALDPRLDRIVALKVSKAEFTERFSREARTVAQLNHPYICTLHDVGPNYLVMEFVDGVPLRGPLPVEKALEYASQILDALDAAHRKGIVHRDLKPGNILVTKQGIKLLDFGLAKQAATLGPNDLTMASVSMAGEISGTLQYMSPEQLEGKPVDPRSDIFAFGLVLYELLTGKQPFSGPTQASVIASILKEQPRPVRELRPLTPPGLDSVLQTCLEKDSDKRWQSAREVKHALEWMAHQTAAAAPPATGTPAKKLRMWQGAAAVLAVAALGLGGWMFRPRIQPPGEVIRFQVPLPENISFGTYVSISPDGRRMVISTSGTGGLWIHDMDTLGWRPLPGTEGVSGLFWSPDSRFVAFSVQNQLKKIDVSGGRAQTLCTAPFNAGSGSWNHDGVIIFGGRAGSPLWKVSQAGGVPTAITAVDTGRGEIFHSLPVFMPDGKHFIYFRQGGPDAGIYAGSLDTKPAEQPHERILATSFAASYVNGYLFFMREGALMAQPFDPSRMQLRGEPVPLADSVLTTGAIGVFSASASGALAWHAGSRASNIQLTWLDRQGKSLSVFGPPAADQDIVLSPDATRAVVRDAPNGAPGDLWTLDLARGVRSRLTFRKSIASEAVWSPDGKQIAFASGNDLDTIYEKPSSGAGDEKELLKQPGMRAFLSDWSRDGRFLIYHDGTPKNAGDIWVLPVEGDRKPARLLATEFNEVEAVFSPDTRWVAYTSNESGRYEIYVRPFIAAGPSGVPAFGEGKWQVSRDGGFNPKWTADGRQIIFHGYPDSRFTMAVDVRQNGAAFEAGVPQVLFQGPPAGDYMWDVTPDGKRFLVAVPQGESSAQAPISVMLNWPAQLKKN
jgi:serine/threonine protein kinase/Tol biopolymer transport system component